MNIQARFFHDLPAPESSAGAALCPVEPACKTDLI
jgi:hypothetical protein